MKKYAATTSTVYQKRDYNRKMLHWIKTGGTPQHNASTHESLSCANKRTTTAASSRKKWHLSVIVPPCYVRVSYCRCCRCICVGYEWYVTGTMLHTSTRCSRANIEKCNNRLDVGKNTEPVLIIPDQVVHDVKNQATKVRRDNSFRWIQPRCCSMTMTYASDGCWHEYRTCPYYSGPSGTWCKKPSYESSARQFVSLNTAQMLQHDHDLRIRPHGCTTEEMMQPPSGTVPTL